MCLSVRREAETIQHHFRTFAAGLFAHPAGNIQISIVSGLQNQLHKVYKGLYIKRYQAVYHGAAIPPGTGPSIDVIQNM